MRSGGKPPGARAARFVFPDIIVDWRSYEKATEVLQQARTGLGGSRWSCGRQRCFRGIRHSLPRTWPRDIRSFAHCGQFSLKPKHRAQVAPGPISAGLRKLDWITGVPLPVTLVKVQRSRRTQRRRVQSLPRSFCRAGMLCCRSVLEQAALTRTAVSLVLAALLLAAGVVCGAEPLSLASLMRS